MIGKYTALSYTKTSTRFFKKDEIYGIKALDRRDGSLCYIGDTIINVLLDRFKIRNSTITFIFYFIGVLMLQAQDYKRTSVWYFGQNAGLDFNTSPPTPLTDGQINTDEGCATICDTNGNLLLYTDGMTVWNRNHQIMLNGTGLLGNSSSSQGVIIIPQPGSDSVFYIFTTDLRGGSNGLNYSIVNINRNAGGGEVTKKNIHLISPVAEALSAVHHRNGVDVWLVCHGYGNNYFYSYLLTENVLTSCPIVSSVGSTMSNDPLIAQNIIKISPDGNVLANSFYDFSGKIELFEFDNNTGVLKYSLTVNNLFLPSGIEFSPNNQYLYVSCRDSDLLKFDISILSSTQVNSSRIALYSSSFSKFGLQLSLHNSILLSFGNSSELTKILYPNEQDTNIGLVINGQSLDGRLSRIGLPNFVSSYFLQPGINYKYYLDCSSNEVSFNEYDTFQATSFNWKIIKESTQELINSSQLKNPAIQFQDTGWYKVILIASNGAITDSISKEIHIKPRYVLSLGNDTTLCDGETLLLNAGMGQHCYQWHNGSAGSSFLVDTPGIYIVTVTTHNFCTYADSIRVYYSPYPQKPEIFRSNDTLYTDTGFIYNWLYNNNVIFGNEHFIKVTQNGTYKVSVTSSDGCTTFSDDFSVSGLSIHRLDANKFFYIYPIPATDKIFIEPKGVINNGSIILTDFRGRKFHFSQTDEIEITSFSKGIYLIEIIDNLNYIYSTKIIIH